MKYVIVKAFDGTLVRIKEEQVEEFKIRQNIITKLLKEGKTMKEIELILKNDNK